MPVFPRVLAADPRTSIQAPALGVTLSAFILASWTNLKFTPNDSQGVWIFGQLWILLWFNLATPHPQLVGPSQFPFAWRGAFRFSWTRTAVRQSQTFLGALHREGPGFHRPGASEKPLQLTWTLIINIHSHPFTIIARVVRVTPVVCSLRLVYLQVSLAWLVTLIHCEVFVMSSLRWVHNWVRPH